MCLFPPTGNASILLGSVGNAQGSGANFESPDDALGHGSSSNARGSKLNPGCEGGVKNSNSSNDCIDNDAIPIGSVLDVEGSDENTGFCHLGNVGNAGEKSKLRSDGEDVPERFQPNDDRLLFES